MSAAKNNAPAIVLTSSPARKLYGMQIHTTFEEDHKQQTAGRLAGQVYEWRHNHFNDNRPIYLISFFPEDFEPSMRFTVFGGVELQEGEAAPEAMAVRDLPELQLAVVTHKGPISRIKQTYDYFLKRWQPQSDYNLSHPFNYQLYTDKFKGVNEPDSELELYFPVVLRKEQQVMLPASVPSLQFDGGQIDVLWDHHENAIEWYTRHFNWQAQPTYDWRQDEEADEEKITQLSFGTWLKSVRTSNKLRHLFADRGGPDPSVRWCWNTKDIAEAHRHFADSGVRISEIYPGPGDRHYLDLWAWEGTRLTVCGWPELEEADGALLTPGWVRIGVSNLENAREWYRKFVGMDIVEADADKPWSLMRLGLEHHHGRSLWWLEPCQFA
ncbi:effector binding domain-containing protein [Paenibacillus sp. NEAU-GSW1]|uniref:GyrI-like domain-containing protein n=1 Tax=Paenibacillus sp. NEAU-GSW1 TaxID=2682486 RepID=UPI0012E0FDF7|nr:effector binding domain-containing protein [Paenibacillus sp. NEAU-GSW1]MUT68281.1 hypothetical protein [Paenibacillus sp. NEAU-GSW1]